jgi:hypothetical protein
MEATLNQIETKTTTTGAEELKDKQLAEALRELASFELSLVGGGTATVVFM